MTGDREQLERELTRHLADAAPVPARDSLTRLSARLADTPQRTGPMVGLADAFRSVAWTRVAAVAGVAAVALVVGVYIGQVGLPIQIGPSGSPSGGTDASLAPSGPQAWVEPDAYSYVLDSTCGERLLVGRFRITVAGGVVKDAESLPDPVTLPVGLEEMPTLGDLVAELEEARRSGAYVATLVSDPVDGHPVEIMIDHDEEAVDDEACYRISEYRSAGETSPIPQPSTPAPPMIFAVWERFDMPDPAPGVFGGGTPSGVVAFDGGFVAVGTIFTECCADGDPAANVGVVWTSDDGRAWRLHDGIAAFRGATIGGVVTDGSRLVAFGYHAEAVDGGPGTSIPATWASTDGVAWQRADGPAPTIVAAGSHGFVGAAAVEGSTAFFSSKDGLDWTQPIGWDGMTEVDAVVTRGDEVLVVGRQGAGPRADGTSVSDVVTWVSDDLDNWSGGAAIPDSMVHSVAVWRDGYVAVGYRHRLDSDGSVVGVPSVWTSEDGQGWAAMDWPVTADQNGSEGPSRIFSIGAVLVGTSAGGPDADITTLAWVSEDAARWAPVPHQPALEGWSIDMRGAVETADGLLAVGRRWDPESNHPLPQAWIASDDPMVWLEPSSQAGAEVGDEVPFAMGHCGLRSPVDFDGSLWSPMDRDPWELEFDSATGTITLLEPDKARFDSHAGGSVSLARLEGAAAYPLCD